MSRNGLDYPGRMVGIGLASGGRGSLRKLTEAKNCISAPRNRIFPGGSALELWVAVPDPLHGKTGSARKLKEAKNIAILPRIRIFPGKTALELWVAVPDPLHGETGSPRKPTEAHGS